MANGMHSREVFEQARGWTAYGRDRAEYAARVAIARSAEIADPYVSSVLAYAEDKFDDMQAYVQRSPGCQYAIDKAGELVVNAMDKAYEYIEKGRYK